MPVGTLKYQPTADATSFGSRERLVRRLKRPMAEALVHILNEICGSEAFEMAGVTVRGGQFEQGDYNVPDIEFQLRIGPGEDGCISKARTRLRSELERALHELIEMNSDDLPSARVENTEVDIVFEDCFGVASNLWGETAGSWGLEPAP